MTPVDRPLVTVMGPLHCLIARPSAQSKQAVGRDSGVDGRHTAVEAAPIHCPTPLPIPQTLTQTCPPPSIIAGEQLASGGDGGEVVLWKPPPPSDAAAGGCAPATRGNLDGGDEEEGGSGGGVGRGMHLRGRMYWCTIGGRVVASPDLRTPSLTVSSAGIGMMCLTSAPPPPAPFLPGGVDSERWRIAASLRGHRDDVLDLCWSPDASALVTGSIENMCLLWEVDARKAQVREGKGEKGRGILATTLSLLTILLSPTLSLPLCSCAWRTTPTTCRVWHGTQWGTTWSHRVTTEPAR